MGSSVEWFVLCLNFKLLNKKKYLSDSKVLHLGLLVFKDVLCTQCYISEICSGGFDAGLV